MGEGSLTNTCVLMLAYVPSRWSVSVVAGGLGWTLHEIGISQAVSGALFLPFSFTLFPAVSLTLSLRLPAAVAMLFLTPPATQLERRFGLTAVYQMSAIATLVCIVLLPIARSIPPDTL